MASNNYSSGVNIVNGQVINNQPFPIIVNPNQIPTNNSANSPPPGSIQFSSLLRGLSDQQTN